MQHNRIFKPRTSLICPKTGMLCGTRMRLAIGRENIYLLAMGIWVVSTSVVYSHIPLIQMAAMVSGGVISEQLSLNIDSMWSGGPFQNSVSALYPLAPECTLPHMIVRATPVATSRPSPQGLWHEPSVNTEPKYFNVERDLVCSNVSSINIGTHTPRRRSCTDRRPGCLWIL